MKAYPGIVFESALDPCEVCLEVIKEFQGHAHTGTKFECWNCNNAILVGLEKDVRYDMDLLEVVRVEGGQVGPLPGELEPATEVGKATQIWFNGDYFTKSIAENWLKDHRPGEGWEFISANEILNCYVAKRSDGTKSELERNGLAQAVFQRPDIGVMVRRG